MKNFNPSEYYRKYYEERREELCLNVKRNYYENLEKKQQANRNRMRDSRIMSLMFLFEGDTDLVYKKLNINVKPYFKDNEQIYIENYKSIKNQESVLT